MVIYRWTLPSGAAAGVCEQGDPAGEPSPGEETAAAHGRLPLNSLFICLLEALHFCRLSIAFF